MSNKLDEYRAKIANEAMVAKENEHAPFTARECTEKGFNTYGALNLPVKFAEWQNGLRNSSGEFDGTFDEMSWEELYKYWLDNIYNPDEK